MSLLVFHYSLQRFSFIHCFLCLCHKTHVFIVLFSIVYCLAFMIFSFLPFVLVVYIVIYSIVNMVFIFHYRPLSVRPSTSALLFPGSCCLSSCLSLSFINITCPLASSPPSYIFIVFTFVFPAISLRPSCHFRSAIHCHHCHIAACSSIRCPVFVHHSFIVFHEPWLPIRSVIHACFVMIFLIHFIFHILSWCPHSVF